MNSYVLVLAVGPVQSFIASARRSRDLWAGSWLLSEIAKAAAQSLHNDGATMIFPHVHDNNFPENVGNKIQVVLEGISQDKLREIANDAKVAATKYFEQQAKVVRQKLKSDIRGDVWDKQINDYVEVQYAWAKIEEDNYIAASEKANKALAARKATRDFEPSKLHLNLPKSSLDGMRETVLPKHKKTDDLPQVLRQQLHLSDSEQLDCVGVVKRLAFEDKAEQFTPITRVAADSWIQTTQKHSNFEHVKLAYEELVKNHLATKVSGNKEIYKNFPYDAQLLYRSRLEAEYSRVDEAQKSLLNNLKHALKPLWKAFGQPCPYFAMLLADGDRMGELLDKAKYTNHHQTISAQLSAFAESVPATMRDFRAHCIYAGGDDVLGLVPLNQARKCAKQLADNFKTALQEVAQSLNADTPTLSVGLAICHIQTPLGSIRALAKRAEKVAKGDGEPKEKQRNALGITLAVRGGTTLDNRWRWDDEEALKKFDVWLSEYQREFKQQKISSRIAYDCRQIFMATDFPNPMDSEQLLKNIRQAEFQRMLDKARTPAGKKLSNKLIGEKLIGELTSRFNTLNGDLNALATELIMARWLSAKTQSDIGKENA